ncbi:hypothetical protein GCM10011611_46270 [Aliidongia dinghuensis]|uniref:PRC-barrel domain-containing protein n=1 Tax=Aliidongia dinghuensis TaxID=1867774 RepID=A0A8J2YZ62_9PROT|nr:PRC-barrel domain-containing protein [Aliidongia dinghuensis]GGF34800.1 hypothetical protein GCM10011611_46270 [Aliidongia dinghuensis]
MALGRRRLIRRRPIRRWLPGTSLLAILLASQPLAGAADDPTATSNKSESTEPTASVLDAAPAPQGPSGDQQAPAAPSPAAPADQQAPATASPPPPPPSPPSSAPATAPEAAPADQGTAPQAPAAGETPPPAAGEAPQPAETPPPPPPPKGEPQPPKNLEPIPKAEAISILGKKVKGPAGEDMGRVVDLLLDRNAEPKAVVIDFGGFLGVGSRKIAIDWRLVRFVPDDADAPIALGLGKPDVQAAPEYKPEHKDTATPPVMVGPPPSDPDAAR